MDKYFTSGVTCCACRVHLRHLQQEFQSKVPTANTHVCSSRIFTEGSAVLPIHQLCTVSTPQGISADPAVDRSLPLSPVLSEFSPLHILTTYCIS